jgi:mono/diheme cytochrome c family protein
LLPAARAWALAWTLAWALAGSSLGVGGAAQAAGPESEDPVQRGAYLTAAAGCVACHSDPKRKDQPFAGGAALKTPFGDFYAPNISPDPEHGIGRWSDAQFLAALQQGRAPDGGHYYPAFPYTSYTGMSERDARDIRAYLATLAPLARPNREHEVSFPFNLRFLLGVWKALFFEPGPFAAELSRGIAWNRGAYLARHLGHCGECHTPRNLLGARDAERELAGNPNGPNGKKVPNITPHPKDGLGAWSASDIAYYLKTGFLPDGDYAGGAMVEVIESTTSRLTDADRAALSVYLLSLPPRSGP